MKKISTIFKRNPDRMSEISDEPNPDCDWVFNGEGVATRKYDGKCCMIKDGVLWRRREIKKGKAEPKGFLLVDHALTTGKKFGWVLVKDVKEDKWHIKAFHAGTYPDGTYELCGAKVRGNPEGFEKHVLISHKDATQYDNVVRTFDGIRDFLSGMDIEGLVFHHPDGRMGKIKNLDYGQTRTQSFPGSLMPKIDHGLADIRGQINLDYSSA